MKKEERKLLFLFKYVILFVVKDRSFPSTSSGRTACNIFPPVRVELVETYRTVFSFYEKVNMHAKYTYLTYSLSCLIVISNLGMQITKMPCNLKKKFVRTAIAKSPELDSIRQQWHINNTPQEVVDISQGKIRIKEEIPHGKRYGTCHNYAFTKLMGIVGKAPQILNIWGQKDYYGDHYLKIYEFFDLLEPNAVLQPGDLAVYLRRNEKGFKDVTHTGSVVGDDCIESKWGPIPAVFEHPIWYVPVQFENDVRYLRLKMSGPDLLDKIQQRLQQKQVKKRYEDLAQRAQQELFNNIKEYEQDKSKGYKISMSLEYNMNTHLDIPDENGITPLMHAERIGCEDLKEFFAAYQQYSE
jgi:hypothetical protein